MGKTAKLFGYTLRALSTDGWNYDHLIFSKNLKDWVSRSQACLYSIYISKHVININKKVQRLDDSWREELTIPMIA